MNKEKYFESVADDIESGEYFKMARQWYLYKYIMPVVERSYLIVLICLGVFLITYSVITIQSFLPIKRVVPIVINVNDESTEYARIFPLISESKSIATFQNSDELLQKYFLSRYVVARESYDGSNGFELVEKNKRFVKEFSDSKMGREFEQAMSIRNVNSPLLKYRDHTRREVKIDEARTEVVEDSGRGKRRKNQYKQLRKRYSAKVYFTTENISGKSVLEESSWYAVMDFIYTPVAYSFDNKDFYPVEFKVFNYNLTELK